MKLAKLLIAIICFSFAFYVFQLSPEGKAEALEAFGVEMKDRAVIGFCILGMLFGTILALKTIGESWLAKNN